VMERTNARYVAALDEPVNLVVADVSFISLRYLLPVVRGWLSSPADLILLIKPQFEAGKGQVGKGGVVRDPQTHRHVLADVLDAAQAEGFAVGGLIRSPLRGPAGNVEFLVWLRTGQGVPALSVQDLIAEAMDEGGLAESESPGQLRRTSAERGVRPTSSAPASFDAITLCCRVRGWWHCARIECSSPGNTQRLRYSSHEPFYHSSPPHRRLHPLW